MTSVVTPWRTLAVGFGVEQEGQVGVGVGVDKAGATA